MAWREYIEAFHSHRPGITEAVLASARDSEASSPYQWVAGALPGEGPVLDLACGSGPMLATESAGRFIGIDRSEAELARASQQGHSPLVRGDAELLPFETSRFVAVACSMALMVVESPEVVLAEIRRVLDPDGSATFLLPGSLPLSARDIVRYAHLMRALRVPRPVYPNRVHVLGLRRTLRSGGFQVRDDSRRRFSYAFEDSRATRLFVESLYAPGCPSDRMDEAQRVASRWIGSDIGIPLRRVVCGRSEE